MHDRRARNSRRITQILTLAASLLAVMLVTAGCGQPPSYSSADSGRTITLRPGQSFVVRLDSNPTTGFSWTATRPWDEHVLRLSNQHYSRSSSAVGAGGTDSWTFQAVTGGSTSFELGYRRPWESLPPARTFTLSVRVG